MFISLGVNRTFEDHPISVGGEVFPLDEPIKMESRECGWLGSHVYNFDPGLSPEGKTRIRVMLESDYAYWKNLRENDNKRYRAEQEDIANQVIVALEKRYPGITEQVEMCDVATPVSFERFTGNWQGCYLGWLASPECMDLRVSKTLPGLSNFYMVGTWVLQSSLAIAAASGRQVTQIICKADQKQFVASTP
jgi:phytoene dehydrogenase-like protein